jgi:DNA polymerase
MIVGLSAVKSDNVNDDEPLSASTRSGKLIRDIVTEHSGQSFYFTNIVKCLPLKAGKIRYPVCSELHTCFPNLDIELDTLSPDKVVLLGKKVSDLVAQKLGFKFPKAKSPFEFSVVKHGKREYMAAYHPSYVLIYKRKHVSAYKDAISAFVSGK